MLLGPFLFRLETNYLEVSTSFEHTVTGKVSGVEELFDQEFDLRVRKTGDLDQLLVLSYLTAGHGRHVLN